MCEGGRVSGTCMIEIEKNRKCECECDSRSGCER